MAIRLRKQRGASRSSRSIKDNPVIIRTLDVGGDKTIGDENAKDDKLLYGFRAICFCLCNEAIFKTQLRAILRSSFSNKDHIP